MPFGLCSTTATFQKVVQKELAGLNQFCSEYTDDIIVYSKSVDEHKVHLEKVFDCLHQVRLKLHPEKCNWVAQKCCNCLSGRYTTEPRESKS